MREYLFVTWVLGAVPVVLGLATMMIGATDNNTRSTRKGLALFLAVILAPISMPVAVVFSVVKAIKVADLPALLPGPKEQSPGQLSIVPKQGGEVSTVRDPVTRQ